MKVISGSTDGQWSVEVKCKACGAVLEVEKSDLYVANTAVAYGGETWEPRMRADCCVCETPIPMDKKTPSGIRDRMFREARKRIRG